MQFAGKAARSDKAQWLHTAVAQLGPSALLKVGAGIHRVHFDPTLALLLNAVSVPDLLERWQRLEAYMHGQHRVKALDIKDKYTTLQHYTNVGVGPSQNDSLVVAGLFAAMLQSIGAKQLSLAMGEQVVISHDVIIDTIKPPKPAHTWRFSWEEYAPNCLNVEPLRLQHTATDRVQQVLLTDLSRSWKLAQVAELLTTSTRSLQRRLHQSGTSFQTLLRSTRADSAATWVLKGELDLSAIAYATGFSDQAHFSRDFKLRFNMSPTEYAALSR